MIRAPFVGRITRRDVNVGDAITVSTPIFDIAQDAESAPEIFVRYEVPESEIGNVSIGDTVSLVRTVEPLRTYSAHVERIAPAVDPTSRGVVVEAVINANDAANIPVGSSVRVSTTAGIPLLTIPTSSVRQDTDGTTYTYAVENNSMVKKTVKTSRTIGDQVAILSGLSANDSIIVDFGGMPPAVGMQVSPYLMSALDMSGSGSVGGFDAGEHASMIKDGKMMDMSEPMDDKTGSMDSMSGMNIPK